MHYHYAINWYQIDRFLSVMRIPLSPPTMAEVAEESQELLLKALGYAASMPTIKVKYYHWDRLRHLSPPDGLSLKAWWLAIKLKRQQSARFLPIMGVDNRQFSFSLPDDVLSAVHRLDQLAAGQIMMDSQVINSDSRDTYILNSLYEESITSSMLEGASTTQPVAEAMLRSGRLPRDKSEQMILNNYRAMQAVRDWVNTPLTVERILELHRLVTEETLENPKHAGRLQQPGEERVRIVDNRDNTVLYEPPPAAELPDRLQALCDFANDKTAQDIFVHPIVRAIILHFWLAYEHPFVDGNGRTARTLFYWSMLSQGYWLAEYISISRLLCEAPAKYSRAFLYVETDENDLTYFILHQLDIIERAVENLNTYVKRKAEEVDMLEAMMHETAHYNHRQQALLVHALKHPSYHYTIATHQRSHNTAYATARADLHNLVENDLLRQKTVGKKQVFLVPANLQQRLAQPHVGQ